MFHRCRAIVGAFVFSSLAVGACSADGTDDSVTVARSALTDGTRALVIPAYYTTDVGAQYDVNWTQIANAHPQYVIVNANSGPGRGPGYGETDDLNTRMAALRTASPNTKILGYLDWTFMRSGLDQAWDLVHWYQWYTIDGIFFDVAGRHAPSEMDVGKLNSFVHSVLDTTPPGTALINWSDFNNDSDERLPIYLNALLYLATGEGGTPLDNVKFVVRETYADTFINENLTGQTKWTGSVAGLIKQYKAAHFVHLIHDAVDGQESQVMQDAVDTNAQGLFITDQRQDNHVWLNAPASTTIWNADLTIADGQTVSGFPGPAGDPTPTSAYAGAMTYCGHDMCVEGPALDSICSNCAAQVCQYGGAGHTADPFCCANGWDSWCVGEARDECNFNCSPNQWY